MRIPLPWTALLSLLPLMASSLQGAEPNLFAERVAPVLRQRCVHCHNAQKSRGGLDLTSRALLLQGGNDGPALVPGNAAASHLVRLVSGPEPKMPRQGARLTPEEVADLRRWIDAGAPWPAEVTLDDGSRKPRVGPDWWALRPLERPALPAVRDRGWVRTPVDAFILAALEARGLTPSAPADRRTLLRRVTFDLHGLPPTPEETEAFLADPAPDAYERLIDRLIASPRYGERWGRHWLDVVHYGDTHGYDKDKRRDHAWPYRDYVIRAFNTDRPYGRFILEQVAGDVLFPDDPEGIVASGFVAAGPWDFVGHVELREGTVEKEKTRVLDRDDMVSSTIGTFCSLTVHCARCHDHKFDPITQRDYYRLQAVFAGVERGNRPQGDRELLARRTALEAERKTLAARREALEQQARAVTSPEIARLDQELKEARERLAALPAAGPPSPTNGYHSAIMPGPEAAKWVQVDLGRVLPLDEVRLVPARPTDFRDTPGFGFPVRFRVTVSDDAAFRTARTLADHTQADFPNPGEVPYVLRTADRPKARYVRVAAERLWKRTNDYVFALAELQVYSDGVNVARAAPVTALDSIEAGRWSTRYLVDDHDSRQRLPEPRDPAQAVRQALVTRVQELAEARARAADRLLDPAVRAELATTTAALAALEKRLQALPAPPQVYAVVSRPPRPVHLLHRGDVEKKGDLLAPGALPCVPGLDSNLPLADAEHEGSRRAALARWLADPRNVLTWRSIANRVWHFHFGRGLVETPNDFGWNGARPTHPELLDWLAVELRDNGQSLKALHRLLLTSATYRQASAAHPAAARVDADNRLLARMPRLRLDAESVRDAVLAVSGKLDLRMGGPGVELFRFKDDHSPVYDHTALDRIDHPAAWRRTVYRFVVRSVPNPFLECLDAADPNLNTPVRNTTLTALQALALLNDPFMVRQAEYFAERLRAHSDDPRRQVERAYRLALGRPPAPDEAEALVQYAGKHGLANACRVLFNTNEFVFVD